MWPPTSAESAMTGRHFKLIGIAILLLVAVGLSFLMWLSQPDAVQPDKYERIRMGMRREEVEAIVGLKDGYFARWGDCHTSVIHQVGAQEVEDFAKTMGWVGNEYVIGVLLDGDDRVIGKGLSR